jgi:hypothetical protein
MDKIKKCGKVVLPCEHSIILTNQCNQLTSLKTRQLLLKARKRILESKLPTQNFGAPVPATTHYQPFTQLFKKFSATVCAKV